MSVNRLRRVTDLFVEGKTLNFGMDPDDHSPVLIWVNKLNSFETEEARRDGVARRGMRMQELAKPDNPEHISLQLALDEMDLDTMARSFVGFEADKIYLDSIDDLQADPEWAETIEINRRLPKLLDDEGAPDDDPRRKELADAQLKYLDALREAQERRTETAVDEAMDLGRDELRAKYLTRWRERMAIGTFMEEQRVSQFWFAMRDCKATMSGELADEGGFRYDHKDCDHRTRLLEDRAEVRTLPEELLARISDALDEVTVPARDAGNSDGQRSSSESLASSSSSEDQSTPSIPEETPPVPAST